MVRIVGILAVLGLAATPAFAHKMHVHATVTDLAVQVTAEFEGGEFVPAGAKVRLLDGNDVEVAAGELDQAGECRLSRPAPGTYSVTVDDLAGHFEKVLLVIREGETGVVESPRRNRYLMAALGLALIG